MRTIIYLLTTVFLISIAVLAAYTLSETPHNFRETECGSCHVNAERDPSRLTATVTALCARCHRKTIRASSHPVDVFPKAAKIPSDFPLRNGKITCATCHNVHGDSNLVFGLRSYFLRRTIADMKFFCVICHEENRANPGHKDLITTAHMGGQFTVIDPAEPLDPLSVECIGCHDGSLGPNAQYELGDGVWKHAGGSYHPIGVHYNTARMRNGGLTPITELNRKLRFFAGKIGCGTCHDAYSSIAAKLVMENVESRLCTSCHMDK